VPLAIVVQEARDYLESIPGLTLPPTFTNPKLEAIATRKTAIGLGWMGLTALPSAGPALDRLADAVLRLTSIEVRRALRPDDRDMQATLNEEERAVQTSLEVLERTSPVSGFRFDVVGGDGG
jgi:hypothetical protein